MSSTTRTRKTRTTTSTTGTAPTLRSVPDQTVATQVRTEAEDKLWQALHAAPNSTAADLARAAKIGKSTTQKILVKWDADGSVTRTAGIAEGGRRAADLWAITEVDTAQADPIPMDTAAVEDADTTDLQQAESVAPAASDAPDAITATDEDAVEPMDTQADEAKVLVETEVADPVQAEPFVAEVIDIAAAGRADGATTDADTAAEGGVDATGKKATRLASGALRGMVEDRLREHPGEQFGPSAIAIALGGKSSGAVSNALDKLVEDGVATKTQDKPKRFALAESEQEAVAPTN